jgi:hypothetical protein
VDPTAIYRPFCQTSTHHSGSPRRPFFEPSSTTGSVSRHLHHDCPRATFHPKPPGHLFFHIIARYACALSHLSHTCSYLLLFLDMVHFGYLVVLCAGTWSSSLHIIPSGIYSTLACSLSHCIAFTFPVTPPYFGLQDTLFPSLQYSHLHSHFWYWYPIVFLPT